MSDDRYDFEDDDDFFVGEEADDLFGDMTEVETADRVALAGAKMTSLSPYQEALHILTEAMRRQELPTEMLQELANLIPSELFDIAPIESDFDMKKELAEQQALITSMRMNIMNPGGRGLKASVSISEAKSVLDSCRNFSETIRKNLESYVNLERIQALESAVLDTMNGYPEEFKRDFSKNLEKALLIHCKQTS